MQAKSLMFVAVGVLGLVAPVAGQITRSTTGAFRADLAGAIGLFRADLGPLNPYLPRSFLTGRREIDWDDLPATLATPNLLSGTHYNAVSPRGVVLSTPGTGLLVSAAIGDGTGVAVNFGDVNPAYLTGLMPYSGERMMAAQGSVRTTIDFVIPGTTLPALSRGFGAVFADVDEFGPTRVQYFDASGFMLLDLPVPATRGEATYSFVGASFASPVVASVRILAGTVPLNATSSSVFGLPTVDVVAIDDLIFGEPVPTPSGAVRVAIAAAILGRRRTRRV